MNIVQTCIGELPEELREATLAIQRERRKVGNMFYPYLSDDCVKALEDEIMLTLWPMEHSFYFILTYIEHYVEVPESEYPLSAEKAKSYLQNTKQWTDDIQEMMWSLWSDE